ncbi:histidine kinase [Chondrocystis sp. NIES-4102]|nr:histidine kinase [Chondrocystis sp. NIES-4102]
MMRFKNLNQKLISSLSIPLYLVIIVPLLVHFGITLNLVEYFSLRREQQITKSLVNQSATDIRDRVSLKLNNYLQPLNIQPTTELSPIVVKNINYLIQQTDIPYTAKIILLDQNGSILASNYPQGDKMLSATYQEIITALQGRFKHLRQIKKTEEIKYNIYQEQFLTQVIPWRNSKLDENYLLIVSIPTTQLANVINLQAQSPWQESLAYLLPTILLWIITYIGLAQIIGNFSTPRQSLQLNPAVNTDQDSSESKETIDLPATPITNNYIKSSLLADLSHELRSPLNAILGFAQIMQQEYSSMTRLQKENLAIVNRSSKRLLSIINDLVDLSKIETKRLKLEHNSFDLRHWIENIKQSVQIQAEDSGVNFTLIKIEPLPQYICTDEQRLRQIVTNLINYCLRYNQTEELIVKVGFLAAGDNSTTNHLYFELENTEFAHTQQEIVTLFDPAMSASKKRRFDEGNSLRLPISYQLAKLLGGELSVSNNQDNPQQGVNLRLDLQIETVITGEILLPSTTRKIIGLEPGQGEYRILIVDDSKTNRKIMVQLLEPVGFEVQEAVNGKEAIDICLRWQPQMIWMDIRMPIMNGYEATEQIKSSTLSKSTLIVALTASTSEEEQSLIKAAGCDDFVGKPFSESIIFDKIAQHLGVRYLYEPTTPLVSSNFKLTAKALKVMPDQWLDSLSEASSRLDADSLTQLLQEIPPEHSQLKDALQKQVDDFDFDKILILINKSKNQ